MRKRHYSVQLILSALLLLQCLVSKGQARVGDNVVTPVPVWNSYQHAWAQCEKMNAINDSLNKELRESNDTLKIKVNSLVRERDKKDSTITTYRGMLLQPPKRSFTKAYLRPFGEGALAVIVLRALYKFFIEPG